MQEEKSERTTHIGGNFEHGAIISGDNNNVFNLVYNFIYKQTDTKLSAGFVHLITLLTFAVFSLIVIFVLVKIVLFILHSAEIKINILNFILLFFSLLLAWSFIFKFINNFKILIIILIPLCMAFSIASAAYILDENVLHVIERIMSFSDVDKSDIECQTEADFPVNPPCSIRYNEIKVEIPAPKPKESGSTIIQDSSDGEKPPVPSGQGTDNSTSRTSRRARYSLRSDPMTVSDEESKSRFGLDERDRPLEYIQNDFVDNGNGTITDHATGLIWQKSGSPNWMYLKDVPAYIEKLNREKFAGYSDWRLPTVDELKSLIIHEKQSNGLYINPIFDKQLLCWTSDKRASGMAWLVDFRSGYVYWLNDDSHAHAVRSRR